MSFRLALVALVTMAACREREAPREHVRRSPVETAIARELTARFGAPVTATCVMAGAIPAQCEARLVDGTTVPIEMKSEGGEWAWRVDGFVVESRALVAHVEAALDDLALAQTVSCGPPVMYVAPGERVACTLGGGGIAFVQVASDGATSLELALDPAAAAARGELVTPDRERALLHMSHALERVEGQSDGEEEVPADGGVTKP